MTVHEFARAARRRDDMIAEIQRRRDWGHWTDGPMPTTDLGVRFGDLSENYAPQSPEKPQDGEEIQKRVDELLGERPPEWLAFATWGAVLGLWMFVILAICFLIAG